MYTGIILKPISKAFEEILKSLAKKYIIKPIETDIFVKLCSNIIKSEAAEVFQQIRFDHQCIDKFNITKEMLGSDEVISSVIRSALIDYKWDDSDLEKINIELRLKIGCKFDHENDRIELYHMIDDFVYCLIRELAKYKATRPAILEFERSRIYLSENTFLGYTQLHRKLKQTTESTLSFEFRCSELKVESVKREILLNQLLKFIKNESWDTYIKHELSKLNKKLNNTSLNKQSSSLSEALKKIKWETPYDTIYRSLHESVLKVLTTCRDFIKKSLQQEKRRSLANNIHHNDTILNDLNEIIDEIYNPRFCTCFCITGSFGSGKTQFIYDLQKDIELSDQYFIYISAKTLEGNLENEIGQYFQIEGNIMYSSFDKTYRILTKRFRSKFIIVFDDLEFFLKRNPENQTKLLSFISSWSIYRQIVFVLLVQDSFLDLTKYISKDLKNYQYLAKESLSRFQIFGWYDLDQINIEEELGRKILHNVEFETLYPIEEHVVKIFNNPLLVQIVKEYTIRSNIHTIINFNYISVADMFWDNKFRSMSNYQDVSNILEDIIAAISNYSASSSDLKQVFNSTIDFYKSNGLSLDFQTCIKILTMLRDTGLASTEAAELLCSSRCILQYQMYWSYYFAKKVIFPKMNEEIENNLSTSLKAIVRQFHFNENFQEFLILLLLNTINCSGKNENSVKQLFLAFDKNLTSLFFALSKSNPDAQHNYFAINETLCYTSIKRRELYAYLYFIKSTSNHIPPHSITSSLYNYYKIIAREEFSELAIRLIEHAIENIQTIDDVLSIARFLNGSEEIVNPRLFSKFIIEKSFIYLHVSTESLLKVVIMYLESIETQSISKPQEAKGNLYSFFDYFLSEFMDHFVRQGYYRSYLMLKKYNWFDHDCLNRNSYLKMRAHSSYTISMGRKLRSPSDKDIEEFFSFCNSVPKDETFYRIIPYIIYHSLDRVDRVRKTKINPVLFSYFKQLFNELQPVYQEKLRWFYELNERQSRFED